MDRLTNVRIARAIRTEQGAVIRTEVAGEYFFPPYPLAVIRKHLAYAQQEEPNAGWELQTRGTEQNWHKWED